MSVSLAARYSLTVWRTASSVTWPHRSAGASISLSMKSEAMTVSATMLIGIRSFIGNESQPKDAIENNGRAIAPTGGPSPRRTERRARRNERSRKMFQEWPASTCASFMRDA